MARIDIRDISEETLEKLDNQCKKYGIKNRSEYIRLLINLDIMTNMVDLIREQNSEKIRKEQE